MKKLNKVAILFAGAALATAAGAQSIDNWKNGTNELVWKNVPMNCAGAMPTGHLLQPLLAAMVHWQVAAAPEQLHLLLPLRLSLLLPK